MEYKKMYSGFGEKHCLREWSRLSGIPAGSLSRYLNNGMTIEQIFKYRGVEYGSGLKSSDPAEPTMTLSEVEAFIHDRIRYPGFGTMAKCTEWAQKLKISRVLFWYELNIEGLSVEEVFRKYENTVAVLPRKPRMSKNMELTRMYVEDLLWQSGYVVDDTKLVEVESVGRTHHRVKYANDYLGVYDYSTDTLRFKNQQTLKLREPLVENQAIMKTEIGWWELTPHTLRDLVEYDPPKTEKVQDIHVSGVRTRRRPSVGPRRR